MGRSLFMAARLPGSLRPGGGMQPQGTAALQGSGGFPGGRARGQGSPGVTPGQPASGPPRTFRVAHKGRVSSGAGTSPSSLAPGTWGLFGGAQRAQWQSPCCASLAVLAVLGGRVNQGGSGEVGTPRELLLSLWGAVSSFPCSYFWVQPRLEPQGRLTASLMPQGKEQENHREATLDVQQVNWCWKLSGPSPGPVRQRPCTGSSHRCLVIVTRIDVIPNRWGIVQTRPVRALELVQRPQSSLRDGEVSRQQKMR